MPEWSIFQKVEWYSLHGLIYKKLTGRNRCHPAYLSPRAHVKLSSPGAFDGLRIHTDEINEVINRIKPRSLTIAVVSSCLVS